MNSAINWVDTYTLTKDRIIYTEVQLHIPGVRIFAQHKMINAIPALPWHYHENAFEFTMVTKGAVQFSTEFSTYTISGGDVFVAFPNEIHGTNSTPMNAGQIYWLQLDISSENNFLFLTPDAARNIINRLKAIPHHVIHTEFSKMVPLLKDAFQLAHNNGNPQLIATYIQLFLHLLIVYSEKEQFRLTPDIGKSLNYILDNITEELSLEELANQANLSCSQYKLKFKNQIGIPPRHFINQQKIEYSKTLLLDGMPITDIAMLLNFTTSGYFSTVFKKYTLLTPREYIHTHKKSGTDSQSTEDI